MLEAIERVKQLAVARLQGSLLAQEAADAAARQLAAENARAGNYEAVSAALATISEPSSVPGVSQTWGWSYEVTDVSELPSQFTVVSVDTKTLDALAKSNKDCASPPDVPGVRWIRTVRVAPTGGK